MIANFLCLVRLYYTAMLQQYKTTVSTNNHWSSAKRRADEGLRSVRLDRLEKKNKQILTNSYTEVNHSAVKSGKN